MGFEARKLASVEGHVIAKRTKVFPDFLRRGTQSNYLNFAFRRNTPQFLFCRDDAVVAAFVVLISDKVLHLIADNVIEALPGEGVAATHFGGKACVGHHGHFIAHAAIAFSPCTILPILIKGIIQSIDRNNVALNVQLPIRGINEVKNTFGITCPLRQSGKRESGFAAADARFNDVDAARFEGLWTGNQVGNMLATLRNKSRSFIIILKKGRKNKAMRIWANHYAGFLSLRSIKIIP